MKIVVVNLHSLENIGDLAILQELICSLHRAFPNAEIVYTVNYINTSGWTPDNATSKLSFVSWLAHPTAQGTWKWRKWLFVPMALWFVLVTTLFRYFKLRLLPLQIQRRSLMQDYYDADMLVSFGGGHFYARTRLSISFLWNWLIMALAIWMGKPLILMPQSIGPIAGRLQRRLMKWLVEHAALTAVREYYSLQLLVASGVKTSVLVLPDLAFAGSQESIVVTEPQLATIWPIVDASRPLIGITVMNWGNQNNLFHHQDRYEQAICALIEHIHRVYRGQVILFAQVFGPSSDQDDRIITRVIAARFTNDVYVVDAMWSPNMMQTAYSRLDAMVGTRMHSVILSMCTGTPAIAIGYLYKSVGIMETVGLSDYVLDINTIDSTAACALFDRLWSQRHIIRKHLHQRIPALEHTLRHFSTLIAQTSRIAP